MVKSDSTLGGGSTDALKNVAHEIRSDYVAGFYLPPSNEKKKHKVEVLLRSKDRGELVGGSRSIEF
jgi:hypothetical protein